LADKLTDDEIHAVMYAIDYVLDYAAETGEDEPTNRYSTLEIAWAKLNGMLPKKCYCHECEYNINEGWKDE